jgi:sugar/nucleoside kinase (ribokinase family)
MPTVSCLGILVADVVGKPIEAFPPKGTLAPVERMELHVGGCAANTGIALQRLGVETAIIGKVGEDGFGDYVTGVMRKAGLDVRGVVASRDASTSATMVAVDATGERTFLHHTGANATFGEGDVSWLLIEDSKILHIAGIYLMPRFAGDECASVLTRARESNVVTSLDTAWDFTSRWMSVLKQCLPYLDYMLPSLNEAQEITGQTKPEEIAKMLIDLGAKVVGLKMGERGAYVRSAAGEEIIAPALKVQAVDSLGAGDAWAAGFLCGLAQGWSLERVTRFANTVGACSVLELGSTTGIRPMAETLRFMEQHEIA